MQQAAPPVGVDHLRRLDHIGFVVHSIQAVANRFARSINEDWNQQIIHDPLQAVRVSFIRSSKKLCAAIELVEPAGDNSPVGRFLERGGGLHHLCYEVDQLEEQLEVSRSRGGVVVKQPLPAVAFDGRRIAWVFTKDRLLLEFLEAARHER